MRTSQIYTVENAAQVKKQLLQWAQQFEEVVWLDSNDHPSKFSSFDAALAVEAFTAVQTDADNAFEKLREYRQHTKDWIFGYLTYDLKNDTENLTSKNFDGLGFPDLCFFQPKKLFFLKGNLLEVHYLRMVDDEMEEDLKAILQTEVNLGPSHSSGEIKIHARLSKEEYLTKVEEMLARIQRGDIYEANFCQEFYSVNHRFNPLQVYSRLNTISRPPFAAFLKLEQRYLLSASPERYLRKVGKEVISQPIKGTARRSQDPKEDARLAKSLSEDTKERSENVMIVDLVRNDLSRTAEKGSVEVQELCGIYTFQQVHQMVSTITSRLAEGLAPEEVLKSTYPMGSMTGAPKISAMKIIEALEESKRGLYSGALGYFTPEGDFDFSVVIRSILHNQESGYTSFSVGGAITAKSDPEKEYEECLLKSRAMREALGA